MDGEDDHEEERRSALWRDIRHELDEMRVVALLGAIPLGLALLFLSIFTGPLPGPLIAVIFLTYILGLPLAYAAKRLNDSDLPFVVRGHGRFEGEAKTRLIVGGTAVLLAALAAYVVLEFYGWQAIATLRDWLTGWRI